MIYFYTLLVSIIVTVKIPNNPVLHWPHYSLFLNGQKGLRQDQAEKRSDKAHVTQGLSTRVRNRTQVSWVTHSSLMS